MINKKERTIVNVMLKPIGKVVKRTFTDEEMDDICSQMDESLFKEEWEKRMKELA